MKNKYLKGAHISERKVRELLKLFCEDLTATQIANISGISRITVNAYLKLVRTHIANYSEDHFMLNRKNGFTHQTYYPLMLKDQGMKEYGNGIHARKSLYGIARNNEFIYTDQISIPDPSIIYDWVKGKSQLDDSFVSQHHLDQFLGIADFNQVKLLRPNGAINGSAKGRSQIDEIDLFWGLLKARLIKFRGLSGNTLFLHVKETEFRYNNRGRDIFDMLLQIIHSRPLHFSKMIS